MYFLRNSLLILFFLLIAAGCSDNPSKGAEDNDDLQEEAENNASNLSQMEDMKDEFGVSDGEDADIPNLLPSDLYLPVDMEIEHTVENELMSKVYYKTEESYDDLLDAYSDYLNGSGSFSEFEENITDHADMGYYSAMYTVRFEGDPIEIMIIKDESEEESVFVDITRYDEEVLDEMIDEMQKQMEED